MTSAMASAESCETLSTRLRTAASLYQVGLEDQTERCAVAVHELEVGGDGGGNALLVFGGGRQGRPDQIQELAGVLVEQGQIEIQLAREVLVQNGFGDSGAVGDLIHRCGVVSGLDEHFLCSLEKLRPPCRARQPHAASSCIRAHRHLWCPFRSADDPG